MVDRTFTLYSHRLIDANWGLKHITFFKTVVVLFEGHGSTVRHPMRVTISSLPIAMLSVTFWMCYFLRYSFYWSFQNGFALDFNRGIFNIEIQNEKGHKLMKTIPHIKVKDLLDIYKWGCSSFYFSNKSVFTSVCDVTHQLLHAEIKSSHSTSRLQISMIWTG